jgi:hypothetical protein
VALRELAHETLRAETGSAAITRLCPRCGSSQHGRPVARPVRGLAPAVSISYAGPWVAVAWSSTGPAGIDIERAGPPVGGVDRLEWTRREALFKAGPGTHEAQAIPVPAGYVGTVAGTGVSWRLVGPAAPSR